MKRYFLFAPREDIIRFLLLFILFGIPTCFITSVLVTKFQSPPPTNKVVLRCISDNGKIYEGDFDDIFHADYAYMDILFIPRDKLTVSRVECYINKH